MNTQTDIIRKIAALLAKANGTENEHEAAIFAAKAHAMLAEHNLSDEDLMRYSAGQRGESVAETTHGNKYVGGWRTSLMNSVCSFYFCKLLITRKWENGAWRPRFLVVGKATNAAVAMSMFDWLEKTVVRLGCAWKKEHYGTRSEQLNFEKGCGFRIAERLRAMKAEQQAQPVAAGGSNLPALFNAEEQAISTFLETKTLGKARKARSTLKGRGAYAGVAAGDRVNLSPQLDGASPTPKKLEG